jgi:hypothetical protein
LGGWGGGAIPGGSGKAKQRPHIDPPGRPIFPLFTPKIPPVPRFTFDYPPLTPFGLKHPQTWRYIYCLVTSHPGSGN